MRFNDIPKVTKQPSYTVEVGWYMLLNYLEKQTKEYSLDLDPDFQRAHVWTESQQVAYVEAKLRGVTSGSDILFNHAGWMRNFRGKTELVDGKQRLTAVTRFLKDEIRAFGLLCSEYEGRLPLMDPSFRIHINDLPDRKSVLKWYLELNGGGTPHTKQELEMVEALLKEEG